MTHDDHPVYYYCGVLLSPDSPSDLLWKALLATREQLDQERHFYQDALDLERVFSDASAALRDKRLRMEVR